MEIYTMRKIKEILAAFNESKIAKWGAKAFSVVAIGGAFFLPTIAGATVTLPETGIDIPGWIAAIIAALGAIVAVAMGGYCAFLLVKKAFKWIGRACG